MQTIPTIEFYESNDTKPICPHQTKYSVNDNSSVGLPISKPTSIVRSLHTADCAVENLVKYFHCYNPHIFCVATIFSKILSATNHFIAKALYFEQKHDVP